MTLDQIIAKIHDSGMAWVEADFKARQLEEDKKPYLHSLMNELPDDIKGEGQRERMASGSRPFRDYLVGMCTARAAALRAKIEYESYCQLFEARRTQAATDREKIKMRIDHVGK